MCVRLWEQITLKQTKKPYSSPFCSLGIDAKAPKYSDKITYRASKGAWPQMFQELKARSRRCQAEDSLAKSGNNWASFGGLKCFTPVSQRSLKSLVSSHPERHVLIVLKGILIISTCDQETRPLKNDVSLAQWLNLRNRIVTYSIEDTPSWR